MDNNLQDYKGEAEARPTVTFITGPNMDVVEVGEMRGEGMELHIAKGSKQTFFVGLAENEKFSHFMAKSKIREKLLLDAVNNRTRERNYYILYSRLADGEITDEDFDRLLDEASDNYVVTTGIKPTLEEFEEAFKLSEKILDATTIGDIEILFSFDEDATLKVCKKITDGTDKCR